MKRQVRVIQKPRDSAEFHLIEIIAQAVHIRINAAPRFIKGLPLSLPQKMHRMEPKTKGICKVRNSVT